MATPTIIKPEEGMWLTQVVVKKEEERIFSDMIFIGRNDKAENYTQWTDTQKTQWEQTYLPKID